MKFAHLLHSIQQTLTALQQQEVSAVNYSLTISNWLIGFYIVEYEEKGKHQAKYGTLLLETPAVEIKKRYKRSDRAGAYPLPPVPLGVPADIWDTVPSITARHSNGNRGINKNDTLVEYATAGVKNVLLVSKYFVQLPGKEQLLQFVQNELKKL